MQLKISQAMSTIIAALDNFNFCLCQSEARSPPAPSPKEITWSFPQAPAQAPDFVQRTQISVPTLPFWGTLKAQIPKMKNNPVLHDPQVNQRKLSHIKRNLWYLTGQKINQAGWQHHAQHGKEWTPGCNSHYITEIHHNWSHGYETPMLLIP